jgi:putative SOS response-associated peptidase YedK
VATRTPAILRSLCGRFTLRTNARDLVEVFQLLRTVELPPRYNIAPTQSVAVIRQVDRHRELSMMRWGLVPPWSKDPKAGPPLINARADTVASKPSFRSAFKSRRCLIPADGFFEWQKTGEKTKQPFYIRLAKDHPFAFAGLWEHWKASDSSTVESCVIITTDADDALRPLHDRMPVILPDDEYDRWLDPKTDPGNLGDLLKPYPAGEMTAFPVSTLVNSPRNDSSACIDPVAAR